MLCPGDFQRRVLVHLPLHAPRKGIGVPFFPPFSWSLVMLKSSHTLKVELSLWQGTCKWDSIHHDRFCGKISLWLGSYQPRHHICQIPNQVHKDVNHTELFSDRGTQWLGQFYNCLKNVIDRIPKHNLHFVMADINAKVGMERSAGKLGRGTYQPKSKSLWQCALYLIITSNFSMMNLKFVRQKRNSRIMEISLFFLPTDQQQWHQF